MPRLLQQRIRPAAIKSSAGRGATARGSGQPALRPRCSGGAASEGRGQRWQRRRGRRLAGERAPEHVFVLQVRRGAAARCQARPCATAHCAPQHHRRGEQLPLGRMVGEPIGGGRARAADAPRRHAHDHRPPSHAPRCRPRRPCRKDARRRRSPLPACACAAALARGRGAAGAAPYLARRCRLTALRGRLGGRGHSPSRLRA